VVICDLSFLLLVFNFAAAAFWRRRHFDGNAILAAAPSWGLRRFSGFAVNVVATPKVLGLRHFGGCATLAAAPYWRTFVVIFAIYGNFRFFCITEILDFFLVVFRVKRKFLGFF